MLFGFSSNVLLFHDTELKLNLHTVHIQLIKYLVALDPVVFFT